MPGKGKDNMGNRKPAVGERGLGEPGLFSFPGED